MKIIHCADIHLDSKMTSNLDEKKAKERKFELLGTFLKMIDYAKENQVSAIIIAGDLFDTNYFLAGTRNSVKDAIVSSESIDFFYVKGNHGGGERFLESFEEIPSNLHLFNDEWKTYDLSESDQYKITLSGIELDKANVSTVYSSLMLDPRDINIVTMHGQINEYKNDKKAEIISLNELRHKNIDYLALGHVHEYQEGDLPPRGKYCYCGCLEGRGFDECGNHGFVMLEVDESSKTLDAKFVPFAQRILHELNVDISGCTESPEIKKRIEEKIKSDDCEKKDFVEVILEGEIDVDCEKSIDLLTKMLMEEFYYVKIKDKTKIAIDYNDYKLETSLRGEFVRLLQSDESLSEEEKAEIIRCGFQALNEEEIEL